MKVLFLTYYSIDDLENLEIPFKHLEVLTQLNSVQEIIFCTVERDEIVVGAPLNLRRMSKVQFIPIYAFAGYPYILPKMVSIIRVIRKINSVIHENDIDLVICHGNQAAFLVNMAIQRGKIRYGVIAFVPYVKYMIELRHWSKLDLRVFFEKWNERKIIKKASFIVTETNEHRDWLVKKVKNANRAYCIPYIADIEQFKFSIKDRGDVRKKLRIPDKTIVGICYWDIALPYLQKEAFLMFKEFFKSFDQAKLIIRSPNSEEVLNEVLSKENLPIGNILIRKVFDDELPGLMSASDFAMCLRNPEIDSTRFLSSKLNAKYWANGLPLLISLNSGDDSKLVLDEKIGAIYSTTKESLDNAFKGIIEILKKPDYRKRIAKVAIKYRSDSIIKNTYEDIFSLYSK